MRTTEEPMTTQEKILKLFTELEGGNSELAVGYVAHRVTVLEQSDNQRTLEIANLKAEFRRELDVNREFLEKARAAFRELKQSVDASKEEATV